MRRGGGREEEVRPGGMSIRLVRPGERIRVQGERGYEWFNAAPRQTPDGAVAYLAGTRGEGTPTEEVVALTIRGNQLVPDEYERLLTRKNLFEIGVVIERWINIPEYLEAVCTMTIDGIPTAFHSLLDTADIGTRSSANHTNEWESADPNDQTLYVFFASPKDTKTLSRLSFSFTIQRKEDVQ